MGRYLLNAWLLAALLGGCGAVLDEERTGESESPIINGVKDYDHDAVVLVVGSDDTLCSGTIIAKSGSAAFVLTAAHCGNPDLVVQGDDYQKATAVYDVVKYQRHPAWSGEPPYYDFMMVQVSGAGANTPVIPAMTPAQDNLGPGTQVRHVGYGKAGPAPGSHTSHRHQIVGTLSAVESTLLVYDQPSGGPCQGDSGGPQLTIGTERVAGVTSSGDEQCKYYGYSGRVSAVYDGFIAPFVGATPGGPLTCDECTDGALTGQGACVPTLDACLDSASCYGLLVCLYECASGDDACRDECATQHSGGIGGYNAIFECVCDVGCASECGAHPRCQEPGSGASVGSGPSGSTGSSGPSGASGSAGSGAGEGAGGADGGEPVTSGGEAGWVAGDLENQKYWGDIVMARCSLAGPAAPAEGARGLWMGAAAVACGGFLRRRRKERGADRRPALAVFRQRVARVGVLR